MSEAESRAISLAHGRNIALTGQLAALDAQRRQDLDRLAGVEAKQRTMVGERAAAVRSEVVADPAYAAPDDGLLARLRALRVLTADPWVGAVVALLEVFFARIELAAVFAKLLSFVPATYATRLAREDQLRQLATAREIATVCEAPATPAAGSDVSTNHVDIPGSVAAADLPLSAAPTERPSEPVRANEPGRTVSVPIDTNLDRSPRGSGSVRAMLEASDGGSTSVSRSVDELPRRKHGRPLKQRPQSPLS